MSLFRRSPPAPPDAAAGPRPPELKRAHREILNNTSMPPGEFARTHGAVIDRVWDAYGAFPADDAARVRQSFADALSTVLKHRRAFVLPRFTPADDQWRMRECISFALTAVVAIDHVAAYLRSRDGIYGTTLATLWDGLDAGGPLAASPGLPAALYHLLVPPRGRRWIDSEPPVAALLANYYAGVDPDDLLDVVGPVLPRYLPGGRHAAPDPAPVQYDDASRDRDVDETRSPAARLRRADAAVRDAVRGLRRPRPARADAARLKRLRLGAAEAAAGPARALHLTEPQHAALVRRLENLAVAFADGADDRPLQRLDAETAARHLRDRAGSHREALEQAAAEYAARRDAEHRAFVEAESSRRREADADLAADARALRMAIRHRNPDAPADADTLAPLDDLPPLPGEDGADERHAADTVAAAIAPRLRPEDRPSAAGVLARLAAAADLDTVGPEQADAHLRDRAGALDQDALDTELRIVEAALQHWSRTLDPAGRLVRPASRAVGAVPNDRTDPIDAEVRADREAARAADALRPVLAPADDDAFDRARAVLRRFARFAAGHGRSLDDATPALATGHLETLDAPEDAEPVLRALLVHHARTLPPGAPLPPPYQPRPATPPAAPADAPAETRTPEQPGKATTGEASDATAPADDPSPPTAATETVAQPPARQGPAAPDRPRNAPPTAEGLDPADAAPQPRRRARKRSRTRSRRPAPLEAEEADPDRPPPRHARHLPGDLAAALPTAASDPATDSVRSPRKRLPVAHADPNAHPADTAALDAGAGARLAPWRTPPFERPVDAPFGNRLPYVRVFPRRTPKRRPDPAIYDFVDHLVAAVRDGEIVPNAADSLLHKLPEGWFLITPAAYHHHLHAKHPDGHPRLDQNAYVRELALAGYLALNARNAAQPDADACTRHGFTARGAGDAVRAGIILADAVIRDEVPDAPLDSSPWLYVPHLLGRNDHRPLGAAAAHGA